MLYLRPIWNNNDPWVLWKGQQQHMVSFTIHDATCDRTNSGCWYGGERKMHDCMQVIISRVVVFAPMLYVFTSASFVCTPIQQHFRRDRAPHRIQYPRYPPPMIYVDVFAVNDLLTWKRVHAQRTDTLVVHATHLRTSMAIVHGAAHYLRSHTRSYHHKKIVLKWGYAPIHNQPSCIVHWLTPLLLLKTKNINPTYTHS